MTRRHLSEFMILNVESLRLEDVQTAGIAGRFLSGMMESAEAKSSTKRAWGFNAAFKLADVELMRMSDLGKNDKTLTVRTHLGHVIKPGDVVLGYDLTNTSGVDVHPEWADVVSQIPFDVILIKRQPNAAGRLWVLKKLPMQSQGHKKGDIEGFMQDIEDDPEIQGKINMYRNPKIETDPRHEIAHLLEGLTLADDVILA